MSDFAQATSVLTRLMIALDNNDLETFRDCWTSRVDFTMTPLDGQEINRQSQNGIVALANHDWNSPPSELRDHIVKDADGAWRIAKRYHKMLILLMPLETLHG